MPLGPYKDFYECVKDQMNKGRNEEAARKICGKIEKNTKEKEEKKSNGEKDK